MKKELILSGWDEPLAVPGEDDCYAPPRPFHGLAGHSFTLAADDGEDYCLHFLNGDVLTWCKAGEQPKALHYFALCANDRVCIVSFIDGCCLTSVVLDLEKSLTTLVFAYSGRYPKRPKMLKHVILFGAIRRDNEPLPLLRHSYTSELAGKKIAWHYSDTVTITHLYVTPYSIRSSLRESPELPDDVDPQIREDCRRRAERWEEIFFEEPCTYIKISEKLYLMLFRENNRNRIDPNEGGGDMLLLIDTERVHDFGRAATATPGGIRMQQLSVHGTLIDEPDPNEFVPSPYWV